MFELKQLTIEEFSDLMKSSKNNYKFIYPERFRYMYVFENVYMHQAYWG